MNPGAFVAGGGGDGGGGGGKGSKNGNGNEGANGQDGDGDANGDGNSANGCGEGDRCGSHNAAISAGDPVDLTSGGVFTKAVQDLFLGGPLELSFRRAYSSKASQIDCGLGFGWGHSFSHYMKLTRRDLLLHKSDGAVVRIDIPAPGRPVLCGNGYRVERIGERYTVRFGDGLIRTFEATTAEPNLLRLTSVTDRHGNQLRLAYTDGVLSELVDSVGRRVRFAHSRCRRIASIEVQNRAGAWIIFARYYYDSEGNLARAVDADGFEWSYHYSNHLLTQYLGPNGFRFHFVYDHAERCIETWGLPADGDRSFIARSVPSTLADGTPVKGMYHCRMTYADDVPYTECVDSFELQRIFSNPAGRVELAATTGSTDQRIYNDLGQEIERIDSFEQSWKTERDAEGRVAAKVDPLGNRTSIVRREDGQVIEVTDRCGSTTEYFHRDYRSKRKSSTPLADASPHRRAPEPQPGESTREYEARAPARRRNPNLQAGSVSGTGTSTSPGELALLKPDRAPQGYAGG